MTPTARLKADLAAHFRHQSFSPGNPWADLLPRLNEALDRLERYEEGGPEFIAVPRLKLGREE